MVPNQKYGLVTLNSHAHFGRKHLKQYMPATVDNIFSFPHIFLFSFYFWPKVVKWQYFVKCRARLLSCNFGEFLAPVRFPRCWWASLHVLWSPANQLNSVSSVWLLRIINKQTMKQSKRQAITTHKSSRHQCRPFQIEFFWTICSHWNITPKFYERQ